MRVGTTADRMTVVTSTMPSAISSRPTEIPTDRDEARQPDPGRGDVVGVVHRSSHPGHRKPRIAKQSKSHQPRQAVQTLWVSADIIAVLRR
jgi:hypothetical protein